MEFRDQPHEWLCWQLWQIFPNIVERLFRIGVARQRLKWNFSRRTAGKAIFPIGTHDRLAKRSMNTNTDKIRILLIPGNRSHAACQIPIAEELRRRGHDPAFLTRDAVIEVEYYTAKAVKEAGFPCYEYSGFYAFDENRRFPKLHSYFRSKRAVYECLGSIDYDISISCNDTSALFDRLVVEYGSRNKKQTLLIQESVRPAYRRKKWRVPPGCRISSYIIDRIIDLFGRYSVSGAFVRKPYGHSRCSMIAAAGDRFRRQLMERGVPEDRIRVTGQPRLDGTMRAVERRSEDAGFKSHRVLLYCNQPIPEAHLSDRLFVDIVRACDACDGVRLLVKLHPRDLPVVHWLSLLPPGMGKSLIEVTNGRKIEECFCLADGMMTVASTTSLEAMAAGLPVALANYLPIAWYLPYDEPGAALSIDSVDSLKESIASLLYDEALRDRLRAHAESVLLDELYLRDGKSAQRIVDFIEERFLQA
jgi:hypothetical protein